MRSFLTSTEFARIVRCNRRTVLRWIEKGYIPGVKRVGHVYQIPLEEVEVFKNSREYPPSLWQK